jgi:thymidylate kinase
MRAAAGRGIFLEGGAAVGKSSLCTELSRRGFRVHFESFVELCERHPHFKPGELVMSFKWGNEMVARMEEFAAGASESSIFFFDRSLLTPYVFARSTSRARLEFYMSLMEEVRSVFPCRAVLLHADKAVVRQRLQDRYDRSTEAEKVIRDSLNEMSDEWVQLINSRYEELRDKSAFDLTLDTSRGSIEDNVGELLGALERHG